MTFGVTWRPQAAEELLAAVAWYEEQRPGLGNELAAATEAAVGLIRTQPQLFTAVHRSIRRVQLKRFPYAIFYLAETTSVVVLAVMHERRDPRLWRGRR